MEDHKPLRHKLNRDVDLVQEGLERTMARYEHSLIVHETLDHSTVHELHADIAGVRILGPNYILVFESELACMRTFKHLSTEKKLKVEFYKPVVGEHDEKLQLNRLTLLAQGIPDFVNEDEMHAQFPKALRIYKSSPKAKTPYVAMSFTSEADAYEAFKSSKNYSIQMFFIDVNYTYMAFDHLLNKKEVVVYGLPREISLCRIQELFENASEFHVKPFPRDPKRMPFSVHGMFENAKDASQVFENAKLFSSNDGEVTVMYTRIKNSPNALKNWYDLIYQYGPSVELSLVYPKEWVKEGMIRYSKENRKETAQRNQMSQRKRNAEKEILENILAVRGSKKKPLIGFEPGWSKYSSQNMSSSSSNNYSNAYDAEHSADIFNAYEQQNLYDKLNNLEAEAARNGTLAEFHENLAARLQSMSGSEVLDLFKNYEDGMLAHRGEVNESEYCDSEYQNDLPASSSAIIGKPSSYSERPRRDSFLLQTDEFIPKHGRSEAHDRFISSTDMPEKRNYDQRAPSNPYHGEKFNKNGKRVNSPKAGLLRTPRNSHKGNTVYRDLDARSSQMKRFEAFDESDAPAYSGDARSTKRGRAFSPKVSSFFNSDTYIGPIVRPPERHGKKNFTPKSWL